AEPPQELSAPTAAIAARQRKSHRAFMRCSSVNSGARHCTLRADMTDYSTILVEKRAGVTTIQFNRPEKRNAMNPQLHREMYDALSELQFDPDTLVLVITGNKESFSAGQ